MVGGEDEQRVRIPRLAAGRREKAPQGHVGVSNGGVNGLRARRKLALVLGGQRRTGSCELSVNSVAINGCRVAVSWRLKYCR